MASRQSSRRYNLGGGGWSRSPWCTFIFILLIGALIFGLHTAVTTAHESDRSDVITVSPQLITQPSQTWERQWKRSPTDRELQHLISFTHIFFDTDRRGPQAQTDAVAVLNQLNRETPSPDRAPQLGDRFMLNYDYVGQEPLDVRQYFGQPFTEALFQLEPGQWQGPVASGYGLHVVKVSDRRSEQPADLSQVYDEVKRTLMDERRIEANDAFYQALLSKYRLNVDDAVLAEHPDLNITFDQGFNRQASTVALALICGGTEVGGDGSGFAQMRGRQIATLKRLTGEAIAAFERRDCNRKHRHGLTPEGSAVPFNFTSMPQIANATG